MAEAPIKTAKKSRESTFLRGSANLMGSSSTLKRTTCDICRERKVRCDRTKPECNRCQRFGSVCTYPSPDADTERIHNTLHNLSKRLEDAERKLQQASVQCVTPISPLEGQMLDLNAVEFGNLEGFPNNVGEDAEFHSWYWDQPMGEPDGTLLDGMSTSPETATSDTMPAKSTLQAYSLPQEFGHETLDEAIVIARPSPPENSMGVSSISVETCAALYETYFNIVQKHLPLLSRDVFFRTLREYPEMHQILALKYAVCMAGAQADSIRFQLREQYYVAARYHLEQAELGSDGSSFWTVEAAQALVLVIRFEFEHFTSPRATITISRSFALMSILSHRETLKSKKGEGLDEKELDRRKIISLINLSLKFQESCVGNSIFTPPPVSICDDVDLERLNINLLTSSQPIPENEPFGLLCVSLRIAVEAEHHARIASAVIAGVDVPSFNFSRDHERIENKIGTIVKKWLASSSPSALSSEPHGELRALALLSTLGTRIRLFNTASEYGGKSKFLNAISAECREECVSSAIDISDLLFYAQVCRPDKITIYREANFYLMPPLRLAAEALITALQARSQDSTIRISHGHLEIRRSLKTIIQVMDACKPEAGTYNDFISKFRAYLVEGTPLRTSFSSSSSLGGKKFGT